MARSSLQALAGKRVHVLLDKLGERMAFERTGVRLYEALQAKCEALGAMQGPLPIPSRALLQRICNEEAQHYRMLVEAIRSLGGDPTAQTPSADLVGIEGAGLVQVMTDPRTTLTQSLHAILTAELVDNAGWELLITLAEAGERPGLLLSFEQALAQEATHLRLVHDWHSQAILAEGRAG